MRLAGDELEEPEAEGPNDCADWQDDTEGMLPIKRKKREKKSKATPTPIAGEGEADTDEWRREAAEHIDIVEAILTERELFAKHAQECVEGLRAIIIECAE